MIGINTAIPSVFSDIHYPYGGSSCVDMTRINQIKNLPKGKDVFIPKEAQIVLGRDYVLNTRNPKFAKLLNDKNQVVIGRNPACNIQVDGFYSDVADKHLVIEKTQAGLVTKNISGNEGKTQVIPKSQIKPFITGIENLRFSQGNIGDCFVLAELYALSHSQKGRNYLEKMVAVDEKGDYIVSFYNEKPITVQQSELNGEVYKNGTVKHCVQGDISLIAIERAYAKLIKLENDSANFIQLNNGGFPDEALYKMTGLSSIVYSVKNNPQDVLKQIEKEGIENYVLTCSTPQRGEYGKYMNSGKKFITAHAYAIKSIDTKNDIIEIVNPHNTKNSEKISVKDFQNIFEYIYVAKV